MFFIQLIKNIFVVKNNLLNLLVLIVILFCTRSINATTYYVATWGNNSNAGDFANPWRTICHAASNVNFGDKVCIRGGIYNENNIMPLNENITFSNYPNETVIVNVGGGNYGFNLNYANGRDYIKIIGITIKNANTGIIIGKQGSPGSYVAGFRVANCRIISNSLSGILISGDDGAGKTRQGTITNNYIAHNGTGITINNDVQQNTFIDNTIVSNGKGIEREDTASEKDAWKNIFIGNYISHNTSDGVYVVLANSDNNFYNNTINSNGGYGMYLCDDMNTTYSNNTIIGNGKDGIYLTGKGWGLADMNNDKFYHNKIGKNALSGICFWFVNGNCDHSYNNIIKYNTIWSNKGGSGIILYGDGTTWAFGTCAVDNNTIISNTIYGNNGYGIEFKNMTKNNIIKSNKIYGNSNGGIYIGDSNQLISSNYIYNNPTGIYISSATSCTLIKNQIHNNSSYGLYISNSAGSTIKYNQIYSNPVGVYYKSSSCEISLNAITNNNYGVVYASGSLTGFHKNNLSPNNCAFSNASGLSVKITNNWWGSTIASIIKSKTIGITSYDEFTPYRLLAPFDITPGKDTTPPPSVSFLKVTQINTNIYLTWNKCPTPSDFYRYNIYRSSIPGTTNLCKTNIIKCITDISTTNYIDTPSVGKWYYYITVCDKYPIFTNESWYYSGNEIGNTAPQLLWCNDIGYITDGVNPDEGKSGEYFEFKVKYKDNEGDAAEIKQVWIDINDNSIYEEDEKYDMEEVAGDYYNGMVYRLSKKIYYVGDGIIKYRYYFKDSSNEAEGEPTGEYTIRIIGVNVGVRIKYNLIPYNGESRFKVVFVVSKPTKARMEIYSITGQLVRKIEPGEIYYPNEEHSIGWDGRDSEGRKVGYGVYFMYFKAGEIEYKAKLAVVK